MLLNLTSIYYINKVVLGEEMGCLKGESEVKKKDAKYQCGKCGAAVGKKSHACKPVKTEEGKKKDKSKKEKKSAKK